MNFSQLRQNRYQWVRLRPIAERRESVSGARLEPIDDQWIIDDVTRAGVTLRNPRTDHVKTLGLDNVHEYRTPGFLKLRCQLTLRGPAVLVEPIFGR